MQNYGCEVMSSIVISNDIMDIKKIESEIQAIVPTDRLDTEGLDYSLIEKYKADWIKLSEISRSVVLVFDCYTNKFIFVSENGLAPYGLSKEELIQKGHIPLMEIIHPEDVKYGLAIRRKIYDLIRRLTPQEQRQYKLIHEMRIKNIRGEYIRVIEQEQIIEFDAHGEAWLMLSVVDADAGHETEITRSHIYNYLTGEHIYPDLSDTLKEPLTNREIEILGLMKQGLLSKEIASQLNISINTVNSHRQNIFIKLEANNAMEAVNQAIRLGITFY